MKIPNKIRIIGIDYAIENSKYSDKIQNTQTREQSYELIETMTQDDIISAMAYGINQVIQDNKENLFGVKEEVKEK